MTALELPDKHQSANIDKKQAEINKGIEDFKQRLRTMYIAGRTATPQCFWNQTAFMTFS